MKRRFRAKFTGMLSACGVCSALAAPAFAMCDAATFANLSQGTTDVSAVSVSAGDIVIDRNPPQQDSLAPVDHCEVTATIKNATDGESEIRVQYRLPNAGWNGKFLGIGNGGFAGSFQGTGTALSELTRGYASGVTDTGHSASLQPGATFAVIDATSTPLVADHVKLEDFGHRSIHLMTVVGKEVVAAFYGQAANLSYYTGCSTGGRQGAMEMQRYPEDYDGVIIGAPLFSMSRKQLWATWQSQNFHSPRTNITSVQREAIFDAIMGACDKIDGLVDGLLDDPRRCDWDPSNNVCGAGGAPPAGQCLTAAQADAVRNLYNGPVTSDGRRLFPPHMRSGELDWGNWLVNFGPSGRAGAPGGIQFINGDQFTRFMAFLDKDLDFLTGFDIENVEDVAKVDGSLLASTADATDPNIFDFFDRGGKTIIYHGWLDNGFTAAQTVNYYEAVERAVGPLLGSGKPGKQLRKHARLFLVPGMHHCGGGPGPTSFDTLAALEKWVEKGKAPKKMIGTNTGTGLSRPLCPYPLVARYDGSGDINKAANFDCRKPRKGGQDEDDDDSDDRDRRDRDDDDD